MKQEKFCREYVLTMNASSAYRKAFDASNMKGETINRRAFDLKNLGKIKARIEELKQEIEDVVGINKIKLVSHLIDLAEETSNSGILHIAKDREVAVKALTQVSKMMGYDAPEKKDITSNGETLTKIIDVD